MSHSQAPQGSQCDAGRYEIRIKGHLAGRWTGWFDGLALTRESDGITVIQSSAVDQAALHGLLQKVSRHGLPLVSVNRRTARPRISPLRSAPATKGLVS